MTLTYTLKLVRNVARVASIRNSGNLGSETSDRSVGGGGGARRHRYRSMA